MMLPSERFAREYAIALTVIAGALAWGWLKPDFLVANVAAVTCLVLWAAELPFLFVAARDFAKGKEIPPKEASFYSRVVPVVNCLIFFPAAVAMVAGADRDQKHGSYFASGACIFLGFVGIWLASGIIASAVGGIDLRMTYGGWKVRRK